MQIDFSYIFGLLFPRPDYKTTISVEGQVTGQVKQLLSLCEKEISRKELMESLGLTGRDNFEKLYLHPALNQQLIE